MQRRHFIQQAGAVASWTWASGHAAGVDGSVRRKLIVIMLRGAVDGLSVVVPCAEPAYAQSRSTIALAQAWMLRGVRYALRDQSANEESVPQLHRPSTERSCSASRQPTETTSVTIG